MKETRQIETDDGMLLDVFVLYGEPDDENEDSENGKDSEENVK